MLNFWGYRIYQSEFNQESRNYTSYFNRGHLKEENWLNGSTCGLERQKREPWGNCGTQLSPLDCSGGWLTFLDPGSSEKGPCEAGLALLKLAVLKVGSMGGGGWNWKPEQLLVLGWGAAATEMLTGTKSNWETAKSFPPPGFQFPSSAPYWQRSQDKAEMSVASQHRRVKGGFGVETHRPNKCMVIKKSIIYSPDMRKRFLIR